MNTWNKQYYYLWGYASGRNPYVCDIRDSYGHWTTPWWKGYVNGTIDRFLLKKGLPLERYY